MACDGNTALPFDLKGNFIQVINGKGVPTDKTRRGINPATLEEKEEVPVATENNLDQAVEVARKAFISWSKVPWDERKSKLFQWADAIETHKNDFADLLVAEQGKPLPVAVGEVNAAITWIKGQSSLELPEEVVDDSEKRRVVTRYTPLGVAAAIVPWNFPLFIAAVKIAPALLTGNVVIVKPSPFTPYCGLKLVELAQQFFPAGVVQSLSGDDNLGPWITNHPGIDKISFTGSTQTGKLVLQSASKTLKRVTLELGGNDPAIVFPDVNIDRVAEKLAQSAFLSSGQICLAVKRIYVQESIYERFRDAIVRHVQSFTVGDGAKYGTTHGPVQNEMQYYRVKSFFDDIEEHGWKVAVGGKIDPAPLNGYYVSPTIIDNPPHDSRIVVEEPFGPILPLISWKDEEEVIEHANNTTLGLGASVWSDNLEAAERVARSIEAGSVWINAHLETIPAAAFGGHKESGLGVEYGVEGLKAYCNVQTLFLSKITS